MSIKGSHSMEMVKRVREGFEKSVEMENELIRKANELGFVMIRKTQNPRWSRRSRPPKQGKLMYSILNTRNLGELAKKHGLVVIKDNNGKILLIEGRQINVVKKKSKKPSVYKKLSKAK